MRSTWLTLYSAWDLVWMNGKYHAAKTSMPARVLRKLTGRLRSIVLHELIERDRRRALEHLQSLPRLEELYRWYRRKGRTTGVEVSDFLRLYNAIRRLKPWAVLECGTGMSTSAIALALLVNNEEHGIGGYVVSLEDDAYWFEHAKQMLPSSVSDRVELVLSDKAEVVESDIVFVRYRSIPDRDYEFVFVDGPDPSYVERGGVTFVDRDIVGLVKGRGTVRGLVDHRLATTGYLVRALRNECGVFYHPVAKLGYVYPKHEGPGVLLNATEGWT